MKKLLTPFSVLVLGLGSSLWVASCKTRVNHDVDENDVDANQDFAILNQIKAEAKQTFEAWWDTKATIAINDYPEQILSFTELVAELQSKDDALTLTSETISKYRFLTQLLTGFKAEFVNLNQSLLDRYSNYYVDTMPLLLADNDISFTLYNINFVNIAKLLKGTSEAVLGVTVQVNIPYEVRFKEMQARDSIEPVVVITNNLEILRNIQDKLEEYFLSFIDNIFKPLDYKIICTEDLFFNDINPDFLVWSFIKEKLKKEEIKFYDNVHSTLLNNANNKFFDITSRLYESDSVLAWAGEGYPEKKLTVENFLKFYKKNMRTDGDYYIRAILYNFRPNQSRNENLPFAKPNSAIFFKTKIRVLVGKEKVDLDLQEFAEIVIDFWHYYKLETYKDNYRLVFKMRQNEFDALVKSASVWKQKVETKNFTPIFRPIFCFFKEKYKWDLNSKFKIYLNNYRNQKYKINLIKKQGFFAVEVFRPWLKIFFPFYEINFGYNSFAYSFFIRPSSKQVINDSDFVFLQMLKFKVG
ncbi:hypothetical protein D9R21_01500 [Spiroplasma endosymbiont of Megaselia nigra]|nr:hypothetical protein D9R21_01500 [Spiroplasma endosymbiont of Megaselia nigra]